MKETTILNLTTSLSASSLKIQTTVQIPVTIRNASTTKGIKSAEVAIKDEGQQYVGTAKFGAIAKQSSATINVPMPGGVETCLYKVFPDVGEMIAGGGFADNAMAVNITLSD